MFHRIFGERVVETEKVNYLRRGEAKYLFEGEDDDGQKYDSRSKDKIRQTLSDGVV